MLANMVLVISLAILDGVDARLPRPRRPDRHQLGPDAELRLRARRDQRRRVVGAARRPASRSWGRAGTTLLGTALEDAVNPRLKRHHLSRRRADVAPGPADAGPPAAGERAGRADPPVRDLTIEFDSSRAAARRRRRQLRPATRRDARPGRRVGLWQDDDRPRPPPAAPSRRATRRRLGVVRRRGSRRPRWRRAAVVPLDAAVARLPGRDERAQPGADGRRPDLGGDPPPLPRDVRKAEAAKRAGSSRAGRHLAPARRGSTRTRTRAACASAR